MSFPFWALIAIAGHAANGAAFVIDKTLLTSSFKRPATYAAIVGILSAIAAVLIPFGSRGTIPPAAFLAMLISGVTFVLALWAFFAALAEGEASRVVPVIGSLIPILTLIGTATLLGEHLSALQGVGFSLLITATIVLSGGSVKSRLAPRTVFLAALSALGFAATSVAGKISYDAVGFFTAFGGSRLIGTGTTFAILAYDSSARREVATALGLSKKKPSPKRKNAPTALVFIGQSLGAAGLVLTQYATSLGSAAIVNALQAIQYAFLVIAAFILSKRAPRLLGEDLTPRAVARKTAAIAIVALGLWLVV
jgi:uncharacterized membrane protein